MRMRTAECKASGVSDPQNPLACFFPVCRRVLRVATLAVSTVTPAGGSSVSVVKIISSAFLRFLSTGLGRRTVTDVDSSSSSLVRGDPLRSSVAKASKLKPVALEVSVRGHMIAQDVITQGPTAAISSWGVVAEGGATLCPDMHHIVI